MNSGKKILISCQASFRKHLKLHLPWSTGYVNVQRYFFLFRATLTLSVFLHKLRLWFFSLCGRSSFRSTCLYTITELVSGWTSNRKETNDERETAVQDFFAWTWVNLAFLLIDLKPTYIRKNLCLFFSFLHAECVNTCCQDAVTASAFPQLPMVIELNHAWWGIQL